MAWRSWQYGKAVMAAVCAAGTCIKGWSMWGTGGEVVWFHLVSACKPHCWDGRRLLVATAAPLVALSHA